MENKVVHLRHRAVELGLICWVQSDQGTEKMVYLHDSKNGLGIKREMKPPLSGEEKRVSIYPGFA